MAHNTRNRLKWKSSESNTKNVNLTPVKTHSSVDNDYSPVYLACTQESLDNVDVLWDWNSPQSKQNRTRRPKRVMQNSSPKLPLKKHTNSTNAHRTFQIICDELLAFQEEFEGQHLLNDANLKLDYSLNNNDEPQEATLNVKEEKPEVNDLFDDSLEHELLMVSQQVEEKLQRTDIVKNQVPFVMEGQNNPPKNEHQDKNDLTRTLLKSFSSNILINSPKHSPNVSHNFKSKMKMNDSFDAVFESWQDDFDIPQKSSPKNIWNNFASADAGSSTIVKAPESPLKFKTKSLSFGHCYEKKTNEDKLKEEIERKRQEALAKLRAKQSALPTVLSDSDCSPIKCSPEEIEIKRQKALAKREQKKQQELIERNRLEALKKLEARRRQAGKVLSN